MYLFRVAGNNTKAERESPYLFSSFNLDKYGINHFDIECMFYLLYNYNMQFVQRDHGVWNLSIQLATIVLVYVTIDNWVTVTFIFGLLS